MRIVETASPLPYSHAARVWRFALVDPKAGPPAASDTYFAPTETTSRGKVQKIPGAADGVIVFIDWHEVKYEGYDGIAIDFMKTRRDQSNRGYATQLMTAFYEKYRDKDEIDWGKIMSDPAERLFRRMQKVGKPRTRGKLF